MKSMLRELMTSPEPKKKRRLPDREGGFASIGTVVGTSMYHSLASLGTINGTSRTMAFWPIYIHWRRSGRSRTPCVRFLKK